MKPLTLTQFAKRRRQVILLIERALLLIDAANTHADAALQSLMINKYSRILNRLEQYENNLKMRLGAAMR